MKIKDIEGALSLIAAFKNADWVEEHLKALLEAKAVADKAITEQKQLRDKIDAANQALGRREASVSQSAKAIAERELRLMDAEQQHQFKMEQDAAAFHKQRMALEEANAQFHSEVEKIKHEQMLQASVLTKQEKELVQRELALDARQNALEQREAAVNAESRAYEDKRKKLRELTA